MRTGLRVLPALAFCMALAFGLVACGGGGGGGGGTDSYTIGGTVSGLSGAGLVLQCNAGDDLAITSDGAFTFSTPVADGAGYAVTVLTQPSSPNQTCTVNNGTGTVSGADVTDVTVTCSTEAYTISGTASGIAGSLVLQNNGGDVLTLTADGTFTFATPVADTAGYAVTISSSIGQACTLSSASGTVGGADVTNVALTCTPVSVSVSALYNTTGADWNDYVVNDGADEFTATGAACDPSDPTLIGYDACLHGGEMRAVEVTVKTSCTGLAASDSLGAFDWACDDSTGTVRFISTGLKEGKGLPDLIDFNTPGWKENSVTVRDGGVVYFNTSPAAWWSNPVAAAGDGTTGLDAEGTIYVVTGTADLAGGFTIGASKVGLVAAPGAIINGPGAGDGSYVISADGSSTAGDFLWIEGSVDAAGDDMGVVLYNNVSFSVLRGVTVEHADTGTYRTGILFASSSNNMLTGVTASNNYYGVRFANFSNNTLSGVTASNNYYGIYLSNSSNNTLSEVTASNNYYGIYLGTSSNNNTLSGVTATNNGDYGIYLGTSSNNNTLSGVTASNNGQNGVYLDNSFNNTLSGVTASNNGQNGVYLDTSSNNTLSGVTASNNYYGIYLDTSSNSTLSGVTASNNYYGIYLGNSSNNTLSRVTASNNGWDGVYLDTSSNNTLSGVTASNNGWHGVYLLFSSNNTLSGVTASNNYYGVYLYYALDNTLSGVTASNNYYGVYLGNSSNNYFTGPLTVGYNGTGDCYVSGGTNPGLVASKCTETGLYGSNTYGIGNISDATLMTGVTLAGSFVGKVSTDDTVNASDTLGTADYATISDWSNFENSFRGWGLDGLDFPDADNRGQCVTGETCQIWDWSLNTGDTGDSGGPAILGALSLPTGDDTLVHTWYSTTAAGQTDCDSEFPGSVWNSTDSVCETTLLRNAVDIDNGSGNGNTLCESGETCLYMPNIGSYQGHGNLVDATDGAGFTDGSLPGSITGVTLMKYETNGY